MGLASSSTPWEATCRIRYWPASALKRASVASAPVRMVLCSGPYSLPISRTCCAAARQRQSLPQYGEGRGISDGGVFHPEVPGPRLERLKRDFPQRSIGHDHHIGILRELSFDRRQQQVKQRLGGGCEGEIVPGDLAMELRGAGFEIAPRDGQRIGSRRSAGFYDK